MQTESRRRTRWPRAVLPPEPPVSEAGQWSDAFPGLYKWLASRRRLSREDWTGACNFVQLCLYAYCSSFVQPVRGWAPRKGEKLLSVTKSKTPGGQRTSGRYIRPPRWGGSRDPGRSTVSVGPPLRQTPESCSYQGPSPLISSQLPFVRRGKEPNFNSSTLRVPPAFGGRGRSPCECTPAADECRSGSLSPRAATRTSGTKFYRDFGAGPRSR